MGLDGCSVYDVQVCVLHHLNIHDIFKLFSSGGWRTMTDSRNSQAHILLFSGDLLVICVSASVFAASLPSPSLQTLLHLSSWPRRRAELNQTNLQKGKRAHRHASSHLSPLLLRRGWHLVKEKLCHVGQGAGRENETTPESRLDSECKAFCGDFAPVLQAGSSQWVLHWKMAASHPLIIPHCAAKAGFESPTITSVAKWLEICRVLRNSSGPFSSSLFSLSQQLCLSWTTADYLCRFKSTKSFQMTLFPACLLRDSCFCLRISAWRRRVLHTAHD